MRKFIYFMIFLIAAAALVCGALLIQMFQENEIGAGGVGGDPFDDEASYVIGSVTIPHLIEPEPSRPDTGTPDAIDTSGGGPDEEDPASGDSQDPEEKEPIVLPPGGIPESERAIDAYFDDVVFVGDSVSLMLQHYATAQRKISEDFLGKAQFLTAGSFSYRNAVVPVSDSSVHPTYQGEKMLLEDSIAASGAKKVYIMLGMNDIAGGRYEGTIRDLNTIVERILEKNPEVVFYFQSVTPRMEDSQTQGLNNEVIRTFNTYLLQYCEENSHYFIDVFSAVCDEFGDLKPEYCSDPVSSGAGMGIHFTSAACAVWVEYLYSHTA